MVKSVRKNNIVLWEIQGITIVFEEVPVSIVDLMVTGLLGDM